MLYSLLNSKIACYVLTLQAVTLKQFLFCDAIPSYLKMSYVKMSYTIMLSLLRNCGDAGLFPEMPRQFRKHQAFPELPRHFRKCQVSANACDIYNRFC